MSSPEDLLRSYLHQRIELGEREIVLHRTTARELHDSLAPRRSSAERVDPRSAAGSKPAQASAVSGTSATASPPLVLSGSLEVLRQETLGCTRCGLAGSRTQVVFGEGNPQADLVVVGEAPGAEEDQSGRPFVGRAGKLLDLLLASVGFGRNDVFICNVLKCRPPGNRNPQPDEVASCRPYLVRQIEVVSPRAILACGSFAAQTLLEATTSIGQLRGGAHRFGDVPVIPTYHPAALLRNSGWVRAAWEDLQRLRRIIDATTTGPS
jgi:uracil-DNA glycosylase